VPGKKENNFLAQPKNVVSRGTDVWAGCFFFTFLGGVVVVCSSQQMMKAILSGLALSSLAHGLNQESTVVGKKETSVTVSKSQFCSSQIFLLPM
jgi:hypothetical protein